MKTEVSVNFLRRIRESFDHGSGEEFYQDTIKKTTVVIVAQAQANVIRKERAHS